MENHLDLLQEIFNTCIIPLLGILTTFVVNYINAKKKECQSKTENETFKKYSEILSTVITNCVIATNQTYVESLKDKDAFTIEAQNTAFEMTFNAVKSSLKEDAIMYLSNIYEDLDTYITEQILAVVNKSKKYYTKKK